MLILWEGFSSANPRSGPKSVHCRLVCVTRWIESVASRIRGRSAPHAANLCLPGSCSPPSEVCGAIPRGAGGKLGQWGILRTPPLGQVPSALETCTTPRVSLWPEVPSLSQLSSLVQMVEDSHLFPRGHRGGDPGLEDGIFHSDSEKRVCL